MAAADTVNPKDTAHGVTILVVDDDEDMRFLAKAVLESTDIVVAAEAEDGPQALERLRELASPPIPTVIVLDNQMPGPSGLEVARKVLAELPDQLIILFSAFLNDDIVAEAERIGVTACVSKSEAINLGQIINDLVERHR